MHNEKEGMPVTALREIKILKAMSHACVIELLDMFVVRSTCFFFSFVFYFLSSMFCFLCPHYRISQTAAELWINLRPDDILGYRDDPFGWNDVLTVTAM
jgi:serine/threonine protein kinase